MQLVSTMEIRVKPGIDARTLCENVLLPDERSEEEFATVFGYGYRLEIHFFDPEVEYYGPGAGINVLVHTAYHSPRAYRFLTSREFFFLTGKDYRMNLYYLGYVIIGPGFVYGVPEEALKASKIYSGLKSSVTLPIDAADFMPVTKKTVVPMTLYRG